MIDQPEPEFRSANIKVQNILDSWGKIVNSAKARIELKLYKNDAFDLMSIDEKEAFHDETDSLFEQVILDGDFVKARDFMVSRFFMCSSEEIDRRLNYCLYMFKSSQTQETEEVEIEDPFAFDPEAIIDRALKRVEIEGYKNVPAEKGALGMAEKIATTNRLIRAALRAEDAKQLEDIIYTRLGYLPKGMIMQLILMLMGQVVENFFNEVDKQRLTDELGGDLNEEL